MHQNAGYQNKYIIQPWNVQREMHEIAAIVLKFQDGKNAIQIATANQ
jgi:hypothetical protein